MESPLIVVLDADPALGSQASRDSASAQPNAGLSLDALRELGTVAVWQHTAADEVVSRLKGATVAVTNKVILGAEQFEKLPRLRLVSVLATGVNVVDLEAARRAGVTVCNVPGYSTASTAQHTFALLLELTNRVGMHARDVAAGAWDQSPSFSYYRETLVELEGRTLGIVGFGAIGQRVAALGRAFGMRILVFTRTPRPGFEVEFVTKSALLSQSDVVSLHCPLTPETRHFIDEQALSLVKPSAFLLNCSRGPLVDEAALQRALERGALRGAGLDVLDQEPPQAGHPLTKSARAVITPHIAWATLEARQRLVEATTQNIAAFLRGAPQNVVS